MDDESFVVVNAQGHALGKMGFGDYPPVIFGTSVLGRALESVSGLRCVPVRIVLAEADAQTEKE